VPSNEPIIDNLYNNESISFRILVKAVTIHVTQVIPRNTNSENVTCFVSLVPKGSFQTCRLSAQSTALQ
jgi:hypothetical protein